MKDRISFLSGNQAVAQGAWEAGVKVACGYPGTPASEILEYIAQFDEIDSQWSVNEKVAFEVAYSASIAGLRSIYASKHVGVNVAMDPLMTSGYMGVNAGFVIITADDPGIHSSQNEQDNRNIAKMAKLPLIEPSTPKEAQEYIKTAFEISEKYDIPVLFRLTTRISHSKENVFLNKRNKIKPKRFISDISKNIMMPKFCIPRHKDLEKKLIELKKYSNNTKLNKIELNNNKTGFITDSVAYLYIKEIYPDASVLKLGFPYPFPDEKAKQFASKIKNLYIIEELDPFIEEELKIIGINAISKDLSFKIGELKPEYIPYIVRKEEKPEIKNSSPRKPRLCIGCPHEKVYEVLKKFKFTAAGDIGCYTLGALEPFNCLHTVLCMGASITFFEGMQKALKEKVIAVIGDSTFIHSGIPGLINAVYNGAKGVIFILDNSTTAMTGSQPHPATGITIKGTRTKKLILEKICSACGVDNVDVINPHKTEKLEKLIRERLNEDKLSVIITRFPCILAKKKLSKIINKEKIN